MAEKESRTDVGGGGVGRARGVGRPTPFLNLDSGFRLLQGRCLMPKKYSCRGSRTLGVLEYSIFSEIARNLLVLTWFGSILLGYLLDPSSSWNLHEASDLGKPWVAQRHLESPTPLFNHYLHENAILKVFHTRGGSWWKLRKIALKPAINRNRVSPRQYRKIHNNRR